MTIRDIRELERKIYIYIYVYIYKEIKKRRERRDHKTTRQTNIKKRHSFIQTDSHTCQIETEILICRDNRRLTSTEKTMKTYRQIENAYRERENQRQKPRNIETER